MRGRTAWPRLNADIQIWKRAKNYLKQQPKNARWVHKRWQFTINSLKLYQLASHALMSKRWYLIIKETAEWWDSGVGGRSEGRPYVRSRQSPPFTAPQAERPSLFNSLSVTSKTVQFSVPPKLWTTWKSLHVTCPWMSDDQTNHYRSQAFVHQLMSSFAPIERCGSTSGHCNYLCAGLLSHISFSLSSGKVARGTLLLLPWFKWVVWGVLFWTPLITYHMLKYMAWHTLVSSH